MKKYWLNQNKELYLKHRKEVRKWKSKQGLARLGNDRTGNNPDDSRTQKPKKSQTKGKAPLS